MDAYEAALDEARRTLDLSAVHEVVEDWRMVAAVQSDPVDVLHDMPDELLPDLAELPTALEIARWTVGRP